MRQWSIGSNWASGLTFSPSGEWLLTIANELKLWDAAGDRVTALQPPKVRPHVRYAQPSFSPDGRYLVSLSSHDRRLLIWHLRENFEVEVIPFEDSYRFWTHFTSDSQTLLIGCYTTRRYEVSTWKRLPSIRTPIVPRRYAADRDGNFLVSEGHSQFFCVSMSDMRARNQWFHGGVSSDSNQGFALSPDGTLLIHAYQKGWRLWQVSSGTELRTEKGDERVHAIDFSPDGRTIALAQTNFVRFLETETWRETASFRWPVGLPVGVMIAPDGLTCAMIGQDGRVVIWDVE